MSHDHYAHREDGDYRLVQANEDGVFTFVDKRTGHKQQFHDCAPHGYGENVYLYHYPTAHVEDPSRTAGYKCGYLNKETLPEWLIDEFHAIYDNGEMSAQTDHRGFTESHGRVGEVN